MRVIQGAIPGSAAEEPHFPTSEDLRHLKGIGGPQLSPDGKLQGESDSTDPLGQAQEMYRALRQEGVPVELVTYPREDHGPLSGGMTGRPVAEPWHGYDVRQRMVEFIEKAFGSNPAAGSQ